MISWLSEKKWNEMSPFNKKKEEKIDFLLSSVLYHIIMKRVMDILRHYLGLWETWKDIFPFFLTCIVLSWGQLLISLHQFSHGTILLDKLRRYFPKFWSFKYKIPSLHSSWQSNCEDDTCSFPNLDWVKLHICSGQTSGMHFSPHLLCWSTKGFAAGLV